MPELEEETDYERPVTLSALIVHWATRDDEYARRAKALTPTEVEVIKLGRIEEARDLPPIQRARAWARAKAWFPPDHGQGQVRLS